MTVAAIIDNGIRPQAVLRSLARQLRAEQAFDPTAAALKRKAARQADELRRTLEAIDKACS